MVISAQTSTPAIESSEQKPSEGGAAQFEDPTTDCKV